MSAMISFAVDPRFVQDLEDDFMVNEYLTLYEFIGKDPVRAFYLGHNITKWFKDINRKQRYLYSKQARHNNDDLEKYQDQIEYWTRKFPKEGEISMAELAEFIINNMFWEEKTEELDRVKLAFFFGDTIAKAQEQDEEAKDDPIKPDKKDLQEQYD